jgi:hypothetical protein
MDHLESSEARRELWYSRHRRPRFVPVHPAEKIDELADTKYDAVKSIPSSWIENPPTGMDLSLLLQKHGFLVFSRVLTEGECRESLSLAWDWILGATCVEQAQQELFDPEETILLYEYLQTASDDSILTSPNFPRSVEGGTLRTVSADVSSNVP